MAHAVDIILLQLFFLRTETPVCPSTTPELALTNGRFNYYEAGLSAPPRADTPNTRTCGPPASEIPTRRVLREKLAEEKTP